MFRDLILNSCLEKVLFVMVHRFKSSSKALSGQVGRCWWGCLGKLRHVAGCRWKWSLGSPSCGGIFGGLDGERLPCPSEHQHLPPPFLTHPFLPSPAFGAHPTPIPLPEHPPHPLAILLPQRLFWDGTLAAPRENSLKIELEGSVRAGRAGWRRRRPLGVQTHGHAAF